METKYGEMSWYCYGVCASCNFTIIMCTIVVWGDNFGAIINVCKPQSFEIDIGALKVHYMYLIASMFVYDKVT